MARAEADERAVVAGPTLNGESGSALAEASQQIVTWLSEATRSGEGEPPFAPTSNICCRREILEAVRFDPAFPRAAAEDRDWCARLAEAGHPLVFEDAAPVYHHAPLGLGEYLRRHFRYGPFGPHSSRTRFAAFGMDDSASSRLQTFLPPSVLRLLNQQTNSIRSASCPRRTSSSTSRRSCR